MSMLFADADNDFMGTGVKADPAHSFPADLNPLSIVAWVKWNTLGSRFLSINADLHYTGHEVFMGGNSTFLWCALNGEVASMGGFSTGTWFHVGFRMVNSTSRFVYLDGVESAESTSDSGTNIVLTTVNFGNDVQEDQTNHFDGLMCELGIIQGDIGAHGFEEAARGKPPPFIKAPGPLVHYYDLIDDGLYGSRGVFSGLSMDRGIWHDPVEVLTGSPELSHDDPPLVIQERQRIAAELAGRRRRRYFIPGVAPAAPFLPYYARDRDSVLQRM